MNISLLYTVLSYFDLSCTNLCPNHSENQITIFSRIFVHANYIKLVIINEENLKPTTCTRIYIQKILDEWSRRCPIPLMQYSFHLAYEESTFDYNELFSWSGRKFELRSTQNVSSIVYNSHKRSKVFYRDESHIGILVVVERLDVLDQYLTGTARRPFHTPRGEYIVSILEKPGKNWILKLERILRKIWIDYGILRLLVFSVCDDKNVFTFDPFTPNTSPPFNKEKQKYWGNIIKIDANDVAHKHMDTYPPNFNGYPILSVFFYRFPTAPLWRKCPKSMVNTYFGDAKHYSKVYGGFDGILYGNLAKSLNFTPVNIKEMESNVFGHKYKNNTFTGSIGDVLYSNADISVNPRFIMDYDTEDIEFLFPVLYDKFCIISPKASVIPQSMAVFKCFTPFVWTFLAVLTFLIGLLWKLIKYRNDETHNNASIESIVEILRLMTAGCIPIMPREASERLFVVSVAVGGLILASTFQGSLTNSFTKKTYYKDLNTLKDVDESGLTISSNSKSLVNFFGENQSALITSLSKKLRIPVRFNLNKTAYGRDTCCVERISDYSIVTQQYTKPDGTKLLHLVEECPRFYNLAYIVRKGWPFVERFNNIIHHLTQGGFLTKWYDFSKNAFILQERKKIYSNEKYRAFTLEDVQIAFFVLLLGLSVSILVFIIEVHDGRRLKEKDFITF